MSALRILTVDGLGLEAEFEAAAGETRAAVVLCHPHPQYGGSMRSIVVSVLFAELPAAGYGCLRFNFRGVEGSEGSFDSGTGEALDVTAAIEAVAGAAPNVPVALVGWSFGADISLAVTDPRVAGWVAIAPPLRFRSSFGAASDPRPKHLVLAGHDEYRDPEEVVAEVAGWPATTVTVVSGASHFFVGRTDRVASDVRAALDRLTAP